MTKAWKGAKKLQLLPYNTKLVQATEYDYYKERLHF
jgi:hypothetical protein